MIEDIDAFLPIYPEISDENFNKKIISKSEFYDQKIVSNQDQNNKFGLKKNQEFISRFLSSYTPYDQLLLFHEMGVGKTFAAIGTIEKVLSEEGSVFKGAVIFAKGEKLLDNFRNEIVQYTKDKYKPDREMYDLAHQEDKYERRQKKNIAVNYEFNTFQKFVNNFNRMKPEDVIEEYSNKIIVIDEIQNIREHDKKHKIKIYSSFHKFLHLLKNSKILLLSGTPMKDDIKEIADVMNLILPMDKQMPENFVEHFFDKNDEFYTVKDDKRKKEMKSYFKGRVSYIKAATSEIQKIIEGDESHGLKYIKVFETKMSAFQSENYKKVFEQENKEKSNSLESAEEEDENEYDYDYDDYEGREAGEDDDEGDDEMDGVTKERFAFYSNSRQASLFVFPDGSCGKAGYKQYIDEEVTFGKPGFRLSKAFLNIFSGVSSIDDKLKVLEGFSIKYATLIRKLIENYRNESNKKISFVYCNSVTGGGTTLLCLLLKQFGFSELTSAVGVSRRDKKLRFVNFSGNTDKSEMKKLNEIINRPDNCHGEIVSVIVGSKVTSEGFSFKNVQEAHILTPHWNYAEIEQAIARGYRYSSHDVLLREYEEGTLTEKPSYNIFQYVSIPQNADSIDIKLYKLSEVKDVNIKRVERIIKESAIDCALNYKRNYAAKGNDNERDCEYTTCLYQCDDFVDTRKLGGINYKNTEKTTDYLYFFKNSDKYDNEMKRILDIFRIDFKLNYNNVNNDFYVLSVLEDLVNNKTIIINKYGKKCYLREHMNIFYLVDINNFYNDYLLEYYVKNPNLVREEFSSGYDIFKIFSNVVTRVQADNVPGLLETLFDTDVTDKTEMEKIINTFALEYQEMLFENCLSAVSSNATKNVEHRDFVLEYFQTKFNVFEREHITISWLLYDDKKENYEDLRFLDRSGRWSNCGDDEIEIFKKHKETMIQNVEDNEYGCYGFFKMHQGKTTFFIKNTDVDENKKKSTKGRNCSTIDKIDLAHVLIKLKAELSDFETWEYDDENKEHKKAMVQVQKHAKLKEMDDEDKLKAVFILTNKNNKDKEVLCQLIASDMKSKNLIIYK